MNILLGICGSVAAYRLADVARELSKSGHKVRVVLTKGAEKFVVPALFGYLGVERVYRAGDDFAETSTGILHIELARWCDKLVLAPFRRALSPVFVGGRPRTCWPVFFWPWIKINRSSPFPP